MSGDETVAFPETLNYTLNLAYQENWEMLGEHTLSPQPRACTVIVYYSHSLDIPTYQKVLFLHVYIQLRPPKEKEKKNLLAHMHVININIQHGRASVQN